MNDYSNGKMWDEHDKVLNQNEKLEIENANLKNVIIGMFPMWMSAMSFCEHGKKDSLVAMRNYYNGRDNPLSQQEMALMISIVPGWCKHE